jgi:hypothetical protein
MPASDSRRVGAGVDRRRRAAAGADPDVRELVTDGRELGPVLGRVLG